MRIVIITDAWFPQINGVVRTLNTLTSKLSNFGHNVRFITPNDFRTLPCPTYPEVRLALCRPGSVGRRIEDSRPDAVHIATEGPLGWAARTFCRRQGHPFTTSFHTRFPEYVHARWRVPLPLSYALLRRFHSAASRVMVATPSLEKDLKQRGFANIHRWSRGVDTDLFRPRPKDFLACPRPISLYVGRVAVEKSIEDFLRLEIEGTKVVVGDGPQLSQLKARYADVRFVGTKVGDELAQHFAAADVFVFPSRTDTFGLVLLEALASGVPIAAYPVPGPLDVVDGSSAGCLDEDLATAVHKALTIAPEVCRAHAERFSWERSARQFIDGLHAFR